MLRKIRAHILSQSIIARKQGKEAAELDLLVTLAEFSFFKHVGQPISHVAPEHLVA
jgi:hypothetical protein